MVGESEQFAEGVKLSELTDGKAKRLGSGGRVIWNGELYDACTIAAENCRLPNLRPHEGGILRLDISGDCTVDGGGEEFGCFAGFERKFAVRFAFLLSIPAVLGANILTLKDAIDAGIDFSSVPVYLVGVVVAAVSGYASIRLLRYVADKGRFGAFAYYCWAAGALTLLLTILH